MNAPPEVTLKWLWVFLSLSFFAPSALLGQASFLRADSNQDGAVDVSDAVYILGVLFTGLPWPTCGSAMDSNDDGAVDISDAVAVLGFLFTGLKDPPSPFPGCGIDLTSDGLSCSTFSPCPSCFDPEALPLLGKSTAFGRHYPEGQAAARYLTGPQGTWKRMKPLEYIWNYYRQWATADHPFESTTLIGYANGTHFTTVRDANGHLLFDADNDLELDSSTDLNHDGHNDIPDGGYAFHEHNGRGKGGALMGPPFTNFWFDDNWLARNLTQAYGKPDPNGLHAVGDFNRWRILSGDRAAYVLYGGDYFDMLALDGLYYLAAGNVEQAVAKWTRMLEKSGYSYDSENQRYVYPQVTDAYYFGLWKILNDRLLEDGGLPAKSQTALVQHSMSLRSRILSLVERDGKGNPLGWVTGISTTGTLINTETTCLMALGLSPLPGGEVFEAGKSPLSSDQNRYFLRPHNVLSAVVGLSAAGNLTLGPDCTYPAGNYAADFYLRCPAPSGSVARVEVRNATRLRTVAERVVLGTDLAVGNSWTRVRLSFRLEEPASLDFRTYWFGGTNLDVACVHVHR